MSQENVEEVVRGTEAGARGDREARGDVLALAVAAPIAACAAYLTQNASVPWATCVVPVSLLK